MKKIYSLILASLIAASGYAQVYCGGARYDSQIFTTVNKKADVMYGKNNSWQNTNVDLKMDIYQPENDTAVKRPLIIWIHGGSFIGGTKADVDVVELSNRFAKRGYVCASINYRVTFFPLDSANVTKALLRAVQDAKASVRYFYKDASTTNCYRIDTNNIFVGGSSAGALTAIHMAYLDKSCKMEPYIPLATINTMGGLNGTSGNPGYSSKFKAVINLCGSIGRYHWIEAGNIPIVSMHGTADGTVPYGRDVANGFLYTDGSLFIDAQAQLVGVNSSFYTWRTADHVPYAGTTAAAVAYMDTTEDFVGNFLFSNLSCTPSLSPITTIPPTGAANLYSFTSCTTNGATTTNNTGYVSTIVCNTGIAENNENSFGLFPNPAYGILNLVFDNESQRSISIFDAQGRLTLKTSNRDLQTKLNITSLSNGIYVITVNDGNSIKTMKFVKE